MHHRYRNILQPWKNRNTPGSLWFHYLFTFGTVCGLFVWAPSLRICHNKRSHTLSNSEPVARWWPRTWIIAHIQYCNFCRRLSSVLLTNISSKLKPIPLEKCMLFSYSSSFHLVDLWTFRKTSTGLQKTSCQCTMWRAVSECEESKWNYPF